MQKLRRMEKRFNLRSFHINILRFRFCSSPMPDSVGRNSADVVTDRPRSGNSPACSTWSMWGIFYELRVI